MLYTYNVCFLWNHHLVVGVKHGYEKQRRGRDQRTLRVREIRKYATAEDEDMSLHVGLGHV
jgi:hypothetical protein